MDEIEEYLQSVSKSLPTPDPDAGLLPYLKCILAEDTPNAERSRAAFGFPRAVEKSRQMYNSVANGEPSAQPILGIWAQRLNHLLWRFVDTLTEIDETWAKEAMKQSEALRTICEPHRVARQPTLRDVSAALQLATDLKAFSESAPDPTLYAVLRAFEHFIYSPPDQKPALKNYIKAPLVFLFDYLSELVEGKRQVDDSSNAWWAVRTGISLGDKRFRRLLPDVVTKYDDISVPPERVSRLAAVPEIYKPIRTISYTLSNVQHIVECENKIDAALKDQLHQLIHRMLDRLLKTPRSNQLYLASVHHEGLRTYLDYINDQKLKVINKNFEHQTEHIYINRGSEKQIALDREGYLTIVREGNSNNLSWLGKMLAIRALKINGFQDIRKIEEEDRLDEKPRKRQRIDFGQFLATRDGKIYVIKIVTRRKYKDGKLNSRYILVKKNKVHEISGDPSPAEEHYGAVPHWIAVSFDETDRYSVYMGLVKDLRKKSGIPMKESDLAGYECLAGSEFYDPA